jgi:phenylpropionate dioxygenase-like ring-hydroxylating dioxygenase large terminal subunit
MVVRPADVAGDVLRWGADLPRFPDVPPRRVPAAAYADPARYERERSVLRRCWLAVARSDELAETSDVVVWDGFGESVVLARTPEGGLSGFHNVCQHRGARLVERSGRHEAPFGCPWHGMRYDTRGCVVDAPGSGFAPEEWAGLRAPAVAVEELAGTVWLKLDPSAGEPLRDHLGEVGDQLAGYPLAEMETVGVRDWVAPVNWKVLVEGLNESWHIPHTHPGSVSAQLRVDETSYALLGRHSMMVVPLESMYDDLRRTGDHHRYADSHYCVFPATVFNCMPTHVQLFTVTPLSVAEARYRIWHLVPPAARRYPAALRFQWEHTQQVAEEDMRAASLVATTRASSARADNVFGPHECRLSAWHAELDRELDATGPIRPA